MTRPTDVAASGVEHLVSILRSGWRKSRKDTWLDLKAWRKLVVSARDLEPIDHVPGFDPRARRVLPQRWPHCARWTAHPSGVVFVFLWRIGRLEVGAMYPEEHGDVSFALTGFDAALESRYVEIARRLAAIVEHLMWPRAPFGGSAVRKAPRRK
jgi:hypothetical protein